MTLHKFKAGDKARCLKSYGGQFTEGKTYTVRTDSDAYTLTVVADDNGNPNGWNVRFFEPVPAKLPFTDELGGPFSGPYRTTEIKKTWIIAVLDNSGKPRPATKPQVYVSAAQAEKVAQEMASKYAGETFMVLQGTAVAATPAVKSVELVRL